MYRRNFPPWYTEGLRRLTIDVFTLLFAAAVLLALLFTLTNGLHDASSVVATFISCGAATPSQAIVLAAVFELAGALLSGQAVANTIASIGDLPVTPVILPIILTALMGATAWNLITWRFGLPSSSTHALVGGLIGAIWVSFGSAHILWGWQELIGPNHSLTGFTKVVVSLFASPLIGFAGGYVLQKLSLLLLRNSRFSAATRQIKRLQWLLVALLAFGHGGNDSQKTAGLIFAMLLAMQLAPAGDPPLWVKCSTGLLMSAGMLFGGWSIMRTIGRGIYTIRPLHSLNSQLSSGASVVLATFWGAPVSTTHVVVGSITGVGSAEEHRMVNWQIGKEILIAWLVTIPAAALTAALLYIPLQSLLGG